ncbi:MAG: DUF2865 domain-containing protein [Pseudomonadota bacterium]
MLVQSILAELALDQVRVDLVALPNRTTKLTFALGRNIKRQMLTVGCAVAGLTLAFSSAAQAQDRCARIHSELASLHSAGAAGGGRSAQLQDAIAQQMSELSRAQNAYDRFQCAFGVSPQCGSIAGAIDQMQSNISQMQRQLARSGGGANRGQMARIQELERVFATQCAGRQRAPQPVQQAVAPGNLLEAIFGVRSRPQVSRRVIDPSGIVLPDQPRGFYRPGDVIREPGFGAYGDTYRTMCVRTSDGFYWPISFSTTRDRFDEDQASCAAMCPGHGVELFAYRNPGQQIDAMISTRTTEPYTAQSYAFAYRESFDPNNRCQPNSAALADLRLAGDPTLNVAMGPRVPQPSPRPDMESDPESRAMDDGGLSFADLSAMTVSEDRNLTAVRVVGPTYGYFAD